MQRCCALAGATTWHMLFKQSCSEHPFICCTGPLNRAEWIKFLGLFFNLDAIATEVFDSINSSYYETKARVVPSQEPPLMAFVDYYDYSDETAYEVSMAAYKLTFTEVCLIAGTYSSILH